MHIIIYSIATFIGIILGRLCVDKYYENKEEKNKKANTKHLEINELNSINLVKNIKNNSWFVTFKDDNDEAYSFDNITSITFSLNENGKLHIVSK